MAERIFWLQIRRALLTWLKAPPERRPDAMQRAMGMVVSAVEARYDTRQQDDTASAESAARPAGPQA